MTGEFVYMLDSDDWLQRDAIAVLHGLLVDHGADIAVGGWREVYEDAEMPETPSAPAQPRIYTRDEALRDIFYQKRLTHSAWGRLYRAELFDGIRYPVGRLYEDLAIAYMHQYMDDPMFYFTALLKQAVDQGVLQTDNVEVMTLQFYAPFYTLMTVCDRDPEREAESVQILEDHIRQFNKLYGRAV